MRDNFESFTVDSLGTPIAKTVPDPPRVQIGAQYITFQLETKADPDCVTSP